MQSRLMRPGADSERLLLDHLLPGVCVGVNNDPNLAHRVFIVRYEKAVHENVNVWIVYGYFESKNIENPEEARYGSPERPVKLLMFPALDERGLYNLHGDLYYIVTRQRLVANMPICTLDEQETATRRVVCAYRSVNMVTCESREVKLHRVTMAGDIPVLCIVRKVRRPDKSHKKVGNRGTAQTEEEGKIPVGKYMLASIVASRGEQWHVAYQMLVNLCKYMGFSDNVATLLQLELDYKPATMPSVEGYILPNTLTPDGQHIKVVADEIDMNAEVASLLYMTCKTLAVEAGELPPDDHDNYCNKIAELPATLLALTIRKDMRMCLRSTSSQEARKLCHLTVYNTVYNSLRENKWHVVETYNTELQLSRNAQGIPLHGLQHALREVVTYRTTVSSMSETTDRYELRQLNASQRGILCMLVTPDDDDAGLRQYMAMQCQLSVDYDTLHMSVLQAHEGMGRAMADMVTAVMQDATEEELADKVVWYHNYLYQCILPRDSVDVIMSALKAEYPTLSWNMRGGILESRYHYGRFVLHVDDSYYDAAELVLRCPEVQLRANPYSELPCKIPYIEHRPAPRSTLGSRISGKCIGIPVVGHPKAAYYKLLDPADPHYPVVDVTPSDSVADAMLTRRYGRQEPLVRTQYHDGYAYGTHALMAEMTYKGYGVEDGLVVNRDAIARGMFAVEERVFIVWDATLLTDAVVQDVKILAVRGQQLLEGQAIVDINYTTIDGTLGRTCIRHRGAYVATLDAVNLVLAAGKNTGGRVYVNYPDLLRVEVALVRRKLANTGDKVALPDGQKQVIVKIAHPDELPTLKPILDDPVLDEMLRVRNYKPDVIMDPLSILSRSTMSQVLSSTVAMHCIMRGYDYVHNELFGRTYLVKHGIRTPVDALKLQRIGCTATLPNGLEVDNVVNVGCTFFVLPPHLADTKPKGLGATVMDMMTGMPHKAAKETAIKMGWQEMFAVIHANSKELADTVYKDRERLAEYPYCNACNMSVEVLAGKCNTCGGVVNGTILLPRSIRALTHAAPAMGYSISFSK